MRKNLISTIIVAAMSTTVFASAPEDLIEISPAKVTGYYHSEDADIIMLANGTGYSLEDSESNLLGGPYDFSVYSDGNDFLLYTDDSYVYFHEQTEKGKTSNGGIYYAVYMDFQGLEEEIGYREGRQTNFSGYIFGNDYEVYERDSLANFFGVDITNGSAGKMEGEGFDTPESALGAYIRAFAANDIDGMISTFAVETYAENYDIVKLTERIQAFYINNGYIPPVSEYSVRLNAEKRRSDIVNSIRNQYLVLEGSKSVLGDEAYKPMLIRDGYENAEELIDDLFLSDDSDILTEITFDNEYYAPELFSGHYLDERNKENMKTQAAHFGAEDVTSVVAKFYIGKDSVLLMADAVKLNGKWYLNTFNGNISTLFGLSAYIPGIIPLKFDESGEIAALIGE